MIRNADHLMAQAIREVAALYEDGVLPTPANYPYAFPNLLTFDDAPTVVEQKLLVMFLEHRMQTYQGTFHAGPDHALCYGWSEMQRDLTEIKELSAQMRREHTSQVGPLPVSPVPLSAGSDEQECRLLERFLFTLQPSKIFDDNAASIDVDIALGLKAAQVSGDQLANGT